MFSKAKQIVMTKHILSGVQVRDIKQVNVLNLFKIKKYIMILYKVLWWCPRVDNEFKEYENKIHVQIVKVMKSMSKTKLNHFLLSITFNDKFWGSQLDILNLRYLTQQ